MNHAALDRARPHDRNFDHEIVEILRLEPRQHAHLRARFDLEYANRVGALDHRVNLTVLRRNVRHGEARVRALADQIERASDRGQHAQCKHIDFEQAQRIDVVLVPLDHAALGHRRVFYRHHPRQQSACEYEAAGMLR